jgi:branched-chain amino acid transport system ATP-binding protein
LLRVVNIHTYYGESHILHGISLEVGPKSVVALLGRNGMGKTTTIRSIIGLTPPRSGEIWYKEREISRMPTYSICQIGLGLVPQGRHIFPSLTVRENLIIGARSRKGGNGWSLEKVYSYFPILKERANIKGTLLSGGEQQMLCIARALLTNADLLLMDEPSEGLAPIIVHEIGGIISQVKEEGLSILLTEQNLSLAFGVSDYVYILSKGENVYQSTPQQLMSDEEAQHKHLAVKEFNP